MKKTIWPALLLLLLALPSWGATYTVGGVGADYATFAAVWAGAGDLTDDIILVTADYSDNSRPGAAAPIINNLSWGNMTWDLGGHTVTFTNQYTNEYIFKLTREAAYTFTLKNGTIIADCGLLTCPGQANIVMEDLTVVLGGTSAGMWAATVSDNLATLTATRCSFQYTSAAVVTSNHSLISRSTFTPATTLTNCTFSTCAKGLYGTGLGSNVTADGCTFTNCGASSIELTNAGDAIVTDNTFTCAIGFASLAYASRTGVSLGTPAGATASFTISRNAFAVNGTHGIYAGKPGAFDQGTGGEISANTFIADSTTYQCTIQTNGVEVFGNTWLGDYAPNCHMLMMGTDAGTDLGEDRAQNIIVRNNTFNVLSSPRTNGTSNYHVIVVKADGGKIYNNDISFSTPLTNEPDPNCSIFYVKGGDDVSIYNNDVSTLYDKVHMLRLGETILNNTTNLLFYNNDTYTTVPWLYDMFINDENQYTGLVIGSNMMGTSGYLADPAGAITLSTSYAWFLGTNFTDHSSWRLKWGGKPGLTGIVDWENGAANVGINPPTGAAATGMTEPYIWPAKHGGELAIDRVAGTPAELAALITDGSLPKSDTLAVGTWYRLPQPRSFAEESMCRAYVSTWREMAAATRDLMTFRVSGAKYLLQHPDVANVEGPWALHELIRWGGATEEAPSVADDITTWIELPQARNAADRIQAEIYLRVWQQWPGGKSGDGVYSQRDSIFYKVDGLSGMTLYHPGSGGSLGIYNLLAGIDGDPTASVDTDITTWFGVGTPRNDAEMLRSEIHLAQWEMLATDDKAKIRLRTN